MDPDPGNDFSSQRIPSAHMHTFTTSLDGLQRPPRFFLFKSSDKELSEVKALAHSLQFNALTNFLLINPAIYSTMSQIYVQLAIVL
ncbi:unnamed protein product [Acanthoscelides obtectus]|uniref:Uncharacterized protein n=1 Tax=Acanthoscelides obtectus TaxID=200917 RepID=A0A9P0KSS1_ACAOB|nr:unnamed protein product [Acanthoscelides obtectus]CAK1642714.1 hypothetical protein AOBTE_LOCUS13178 [Acanthoscelides obtectus]